ncbi:MAG: M48 family metallopeptidase [Thermoplasmatota archaeon]
MVANASLRYPGEWFDLAIALIIGTLIFLVLGFLTGGVCCFWGLIGLIVMLLMVAVANNHLKEVCTHVSKENTPEVQAICNEVSSKLGMGLPEIYIDGSNEINAYTRGIVTPVVVLHKGLLDVMDRGELRFVLGHEFGHIKLFHFAIRTMFDSSIFRIPVIVYIPLLVFRMLFLNGRMSRSMEHSADRAGLVACGDIEDAVSCMIKLRTGQDKVDRRTVARAVAGRLDLDEEEGFLSELLSTHPELEDRIRELVDHSRNERIGWPDRG